MVGAGTSGRGRDARIAFAAVCAAWVVLVARPAAADAGIPMLAVMWPLSWLMFVPIVAVEALVARRVIERDMRHSLKISLIANAWSTLAGIPLTWFALVIIEVVALFLTMGLPEKIGHILAAPFMAPALGSDAKPWMVVAAALFLCVPFFFVSMRLEAWVAVQRFNVSKEAARRWSLLANLITYGATVAVVLIAALVWHLRS